MTDAPPLTPRQRQVAKLVADGLSNREIAEAMRISVRTVHAHLGHIALRLAGTGRTRERILRWLMRAS